MHHTSSLSNNSPSPKNSSEWIWHQWQTDKQPDVVAYMERNYPPTWTYQAFAPQFTASLFDPAHWAELFAASGARYVVITAKHHEGFPLYPSKVKVGRSHRCGHTLH